MTGLHDGADMTGLHDKTGGAGADMTSIASVQDLGFAYARDAVLRNVSLEVHAHEVLALVGPNGAGKTTLLKILAGLLQTKNGTVIVPEPRPKRVAYLSQSEGLPKDFLVRDVVALGRHAQRHWLSFHENDHDRRAIQAALVATDTARFATRRVGSLSGGEAQRVALARALAGEPEMLLLDEPTNHLDVTHQGDLLALLHAQAAQGLAVVMVVHDLNLAALAGRMALLACGELIAVGPSETVFESLHRAYGAKLEVLRTLDGRKVVMPKA